MGQVIAEVTRRSRRDLFRMPRDGKAAPNNPRRRHAPRSRIALRPVSPKQKISENQRTAAEPDPYDSLNQLI